VSGEVTESLSDDERARAERMLSALKAQRWSRARGVLRELLARYVEADPRTLGFNTGAHGKPGLAERCTRDPAESDGTSARPTRLSFNVSHSGQLALYAFASSGAVGIDVEVVRRRLDGVVIAGRAFGPLEALRLEGLDPATREREFLRMWTRYEASLKCRGRGIEASVTGRSGGAPSVAELEVGPRAVAAVATREPRAELFCWVWLGHTTSAPALPRVRSDGSRSARAGPAHRRATCRWRPPHARARSGP
jgi:4'-phosphopantetheinyl transferase